MGSWVNTYRYTDDLADKVEQAGHHAHRTNQYHQKLMALPARGIVAKAEATAKSLEKEYEDLGWAAYRRVMATVYGWHAARPTIFGHGMAPGQIPSPPATEDEGGATRTSETVAPSSNGHRPFSSQEVSP